MNKTCLTIAIIFLVLQVISVNHFASKGEEVSSLRNEIKSIELENESLRKSLLVKSSLKSLQEKAESLNLSSQSVLFEKSTQPVAGRYGNP
jgi:hypothetical protein